MGNFADTSALAKLYHQELGSDYIEALLQRRAGSLLISRLTIIKMESVLAIRGGQAQASDHELRALHQRIQFRP
jgi:uncharacterized protein with PIN domain